MKNKKQTRTVKPHPEFTHGIKICLALAVVCRAKTEEELADCKPSQSERLEGSVASMSGYIGALEMLIDLPVRRRKKT